MAISFREDSHNRGFTLGTNHEAQANHPKDHWRASHFFPWSPQSHFFRRKIENKSIKTHSEATLSKQVAQIPNNKSITKDTMCRTAKAASLKREKPPFRCSGTNIRSLYAQENFYCLSKYLEEETPDIMFINETWHHEGQSRAIPNKKYKILLSALSEERGGGVAIIHRSDWIVRPLFPEFHCRNFILARLSSSSANPVLIFCVYFPPDGARKLEMMRKVSRVTAFLRDRYSSCSLFGFGDLNADLRGELKGENKRMRRVLNVCRLKPEILDGGNVHTREQGDHRSYLDYFLTSGVKISDLQVREGIGRSDHKMVTCTLRDMNPIKRRRRLVFSKTRAADLFREMVKSEDFKCLLEKSPLTLFRKISGRLARGSIIFEPLARSYFSSIKSVMKS